VTFSADLTAYINRTNRRASEVQRAVALQLTSSVITRTPVDTGRLRGNTNVEIGRADGSTSASRTEQQALSAGRAKIAEFDPGDVLFITNAMPYMRKIEYGQYGSGPKTVNGYSRQAPQGVFRVTAEEFAQAVRRAARNVR